MNVKEIIQTRLNNNANDFDEIIADVLIEFGNMEKEIAELKAAKKLNIEEIQNVRRTLERGLKMAQNPPIQDSYIDIFQHGLDLLESAGLIFPDVTKSNINELHNETELVAENNK